MDILGTVIVEAGQEPFMWCGGFAGGQGNPNLKSSSVRMPIELKLFSRERKWMKVVLLSFACILISMWHPHTYL